ncbi:radical SAM protein [bacterium]|nr:radical SAM protein [bacterium]
MKISQVKSLARLASPMPTLPSYLIFFVTNRCEAMCGHCFYWRQINSNTDELSLEEIESVLKSLGSMVQVTITGGSPELQNHVSDILKLVHRYNNPLNITFCSNGNHPFKLENILISYLGEHPDAALTVDISLDALGEECDEIRGVQGLFKRAVSSFEVVSRLKSDFPNLRLGCGICVSGLNYNSSFDTAKWAVENLDLDNLTPILVRGQTREPEAAKKYTDVFLKISEFAEQQLKTEKLRGYSNFTKIVNSKDFVQKELIAEIARSDKMPIRCSALSETAVLYPNGDVPICELRGEVIGNVRSAGYDFRNIWQSSVLKDSMRKVDEEECYCWHQCFLSASMMKSRSTQRKIASKLIKTALAGIRNG